MKILVINICVRPYIDQLLPPVGLGYILTAIDRAGFEYELLDIDAHRYSNEEVEKIIRNKQFDIAAFGCIVTGYRIVKWLAKVIKEKNKNIPVIAGNSVATSIPGLLLTKTDVDIAVMGEGDITIIELIRAIIDNRPLDEVKGICFKRGGEIIRTPERGLISDIDSVPNVNWDLFDIQIYLEKSKTLIPEPYLMDYDSLVAMPVNSARGCIYNCDFCYHVFRGKKYRPRSARSICKEIKDLKEKYGINFVLFYDELTLYSKKQCGELCDEIMKEKLDNITYEACARGNLFGEGDVELAKKLKKAGFHHISYSLESADEGILRHMNKKVTLEEFKTQSRILQKAGIFTETSLVVGYPEETLESIQKTFNACYEANIYPSTGYLLPQPGTPIYEYAKKAGKIKDEEEYLINVVGDRQDFRINLTQLSQEEITNAVKTNLMAISKKFNLDLNESKLLKTGHYRTTGNKVSSPDTLNKDKIS